MPVVLLVLAFLVLCLLLAKGSSSPRGNGASAPPTGERLAGEEGEEIACGIIQAALRDGDRFFTNVEVEYEEKPAELDAVIVNRYGVFVIEIKNYKGDLDGTEEDYEWIKYKPTVSGDVDVRTVKNPIKQVNRQVFILSRYLKEQGARAWVRGFAFLVEENSPVHSEQILEDAEDIDRAIHTKDRELLDAGRIAAIARLLAERGGEVC
ncbi:MAG: NERD domain-containing protein [Clostridia bacterium]|nr:NERD domain-containing protein [Clostridia bacterium]